MSGPARVVAFALALLAVFAGAAAVAYAVGPLDRGQTTAEENHDGEAEEIIAAAAMAFSSVFVVTNSLRLRRFSSPREGAPS